MPRVTPIKIDGKLYHLARNEKVWREEAKIRWQFELDKYPADAPWHWHHVAGRAGVLKLMIENTCPLLESEHIYEKCGDPKFSHIPHDKAMEMVVRYFGIALYQRLMNLGRTEKFNPSVDLMK